MRWHWGLSVALLLIVMGLACKGGSAAHSLADEAGRIAAGLVRQGDELPDGSRVIQQADIVLPPSVVDDAPTLVEQRTVELLQPHAADTTTSEFSDVISVACSAKEMYELQKAPTIEDAVSSLVGMAEGGRHERVRSLAEDLAAANSSDEAAAELAVFAVCEL